MAIPFFDFNFKGTIWWFINCMLIIEKEIERHVMKIITIKKWTVGVKLLYWQYRLY